MDKFPKDAPKRRISMSILNDKTREVKPTHPGKMLREDFMPDYNLTVKALAEKLKVSRQTVNELVHERRNLSPEMALRLSHLFGNTPEFWLNAQREIDLWNAKSKLSKTVEKIKPLKTAYPHNFHNATKQSGI